MACDMIDGMVGDVVDMADVTDVVADGLIIGHSKSDMAPLSKAKT